MFNVKEMIVSGIKSIVGFVKDKAIAFAGFIAKASFTNIAKYAVGAGIAIGTVVMTLKFFRDKLNMIRSKENKNPVEKILDLNFYNYRKKRKLHPGMKKVSKVLYNDKPRRDHKLYGWANSFVDKYEEKYGKLDRWAYDDPASETWWDENIRFMYDDGREDPSVTERVDSFLDNFFNGDTMGHKDPDYDGDLRNVWDYGCLHGFGCDYDY